MRARRGDRRRDYLTDALTFLNGWIHEGPEIRRTLNLDDCQHAALTERLKIVADTLQIRPEVRRSDGRTQIRVCSQGPTLTAGEVTLAARIEGLYRTIVDLPS